MKLDSLRWVLLTLALLALLVMTFRGATPGRLALASVCALSWYGLSRRKTTSLDRERFAGGRLGRRA